MKWLMVAERNDIWLRKTVYGICKHLAKQVITVVLLAKTILLFWTTQLIFFFFCGTIRKNVQEIVKFFFFFCYFCPVLQLPVMTNLVSTHCHSAGRADWEGMCGTAPPGGAVLPGL